MLSRLYTRWAASKLALAPPRQPLLDPAARTGIAIAAIVRNEAAHIVEWAAHHQSVGVTHFFIYDDGSTDATIDLLREHLGRSADLTVTPWVQRLTDVRLGRDLHNQVLAYAHAAANHANKVRWMAFIDVDEFLVPVCHDTLGQALAKLAHLPALNLPQINYLCLSEESPPQGLLRGATKRLPDDMARKHGMLGFKTLADPSRITAMRVHSAEIDGKDAAWNDRGLCTTVEGRSKPGFATADVIRLHHYYVRSQRDLANKVTRGPNLPKRHAAYAAKVLQNVRLTSEALREDSFAADWMAGKRWPLNDQELGK